MNEESGRAHVYVSGDVQGVFFRDATEKKARELGLTGWVSNLPDGRVEALFEGPRERVDEMVEWCEHGSSRATVEDVEAEYGDPRGDLEGFEVR